jgi:ubiquinone/menaquinone biosynthesis C-methylase UbiE
MLDVGCGNHPRGDVNVDRFIRATTHRGELNYSLNPHHIPNLVCADMHALPFIDEAFDAVLSSHVIEHSSRPFNVLKEMMRVSRSTVEIWCPHRFEAMLFSSQRKVWLRQHHVSHFTRRWFIQASNLLDLEIMSNECKRLRGFPHRYLPLLQFPLEIHFKARKSKPVAFK